MKVAAILAAKKPAAITIKPTGTIAELSKLIRENRIGAAIVSTDGVTVEGVITERDIAYGIATHKGDMHAIPVSILMTKAVITCSPGDLVSFVASTMLSRNIRHLPVTDGGRLVGMISIRDVLKSHVDELQQQTALLLSQAARPVEELQDR